MKHHLANARSKVGATTTAQRVWILAARLPEPKAAADTQEAGLVERRELGLAMPVGTVTT